MSLLAKTRTQKPRDYLAVIDIGSHKTSCMVARRVRQGTSQEFQLLGVGQQISRGLKGGHIVDMEALEDSLLNAIHSAEQQAGVTIEEILVSLPAQALSSQIMTHEISLGDEPIEGSYLRRLMAIEGKIAPDQQLIHALPLEYSVDDVRGIRDPKGLTGKTLGVRLHVITVGVSFIRNLSRCIGRCHLDIAGYVAAPLASGLATLVEDELQLGVTLLDMGGWGTSIASYVEGNLVYLAYIPIGGNHVTYDIARGLSTPLAQAERLKTLYGSVSPTTADDREAILVPLLGENQAAQINQIPKTTLTHIIRARLEEVLDLSVQALQGTTIGPLVMQRIVLTGGASQLGGVRDFISTHYAKTVRVGQPTGLKGGQDAIQNPSLATCVGLVHYAAQDSSAQDVMRFAVTTSNVFRRFYAWVRENF